MSLSWQKSGYRSEVSAPTYMRTQARLQPAISNQIGRPRTSMHRSKPSNSIISSQNQYSSQSQWDSQSFPLSQRSGSESQSLLNPSSSQSQKSSEDEKLLHDGPSVQAQLHLLTCQMAGATAMIVHNHDVLSGQFELILPDHNHDVFLQLC